MTDCICTCLMCHLYGHRPDLIHSPNCPEWMSKSQYKRVTYQRTGKFPMHEGGKK